MKKNIFYVAGVGASAGGLKALEEFFGSVPIDPEISFVVVQHLARDYKTQLDRIISKQTTLSVKLLDENQRALPKHIYVLPGRLRVTIKNGILTLRERRHEEVINYSIIEFMISLAQDQKEKAIGIILSGTGVDGASGAKEISDNGGIILVQDPASAEFKSMPIAAILSDSPDKILSPSELGSRLIEIVNKRNSVKAGKA